MSTTEATTARPDLHAQDPRWSGIIPTLIERLERPQ